MVKNLRLRGTAVGNAHATTETGFVGGIFAFGFRFMPLFHLVVLSLDTSNSRSSWLSSISSLTVGKTGDEESLVFLQQNAEDVNDDGLPNKVRHFNTQKTAS